VPKIIQFGTFIHLLQLTRKNIKWPRLIWPTLYHGNKNSLFQNVGLCQMVIATLSIKSPNADSTMY